jgi:hypothetical protein
LLLCLFLINRNLILKQRMVLKLIFLKIYFEKIAFLPLLCNYNFIVNFIISSMIFRESDLNPRREFVIRFYKEMDDMVVLRWTLLQNASTLESLHCNDHTFERILIISNKKSWACSIWRYPHFQFLLIIIKLIL